MGWRATFSNGARHGSHCTHALLRRALMIGEPLNDCDTRCATGRCVADGCVSRRTWLATVAAMASAAGAATVCLAGRHAQAAEVGDEQPVIVTLSLFRSQIEVQFAPGFGDAVREQALAWVRTSAGAVAGYFGRFPVPRLELLLQPVDGVGARSGVSFAEPSAMVRVRLGLESTPQSLQGDWILVHEMVHLAVPRVPRAQAWLHEGLATYVESLARGRAGLLSAASVWRGWVQAMPQGQPLADDRGLDHTPTWARTYWGGALFCLLADVRMRQHGSPERGLQQALQGVLAAGGDYRVAWPVARILATADAAVGLTTLTDLYQQMKDKPMVVDLDALWRELGVEATTLRDDAPLAAVRRAILS